MANYSFTSIDATLKELEQGLTQVMADPAQALDMKTYMRFYTLIHDHMAYDKKMRQGISHATTQTHSATLYSWLNDFLAAHLTQLIAEMSKQDGDTRASSYAEHLGRYQAAAKYNSHIFRPLELHWIMREQDEGNKSVCTIYQLHMVRWKEDILRDESIGKVSNFDTLLGEGDIEQPVGKEEPNDKTA